MYEINIFELRNDELNVKNILAVLHKDLCKTPAAMNAISK